MVIIRKEKPQDIEEIAHIASAAFPGPGEMQLVEALRQNGKISLSLVAIVDGKPVGHIIFSPMQVISSEAEVEEVLGLGPLAVLPSYQRQGIGTALCSKGLAMCREAGHQAVLVLGHPSYYPRFGFEPAARYQISCAYDVPSEAFMALELQEAALEGVTGVAHYQPEFDGV